MRKFEYRCPNDGKLFFKGPAGVVVETKCGRCRKLVTPEAQADEVVVYRVYQCEGCKRRQTVEFPQNEKAYCLVCGTRTLVIVDEVRFGAESPEKAASDVR